MYFGNRLLILSPISCIGSTLARDLLMAGVDIGMIKARTYPFMWSHDKKWPYRGLMVTPILAQGWSPPPWSFLRPSTVCWSMTLTPSQSILWPVFSTVVQQTADVICLWCLFCPGSSLLHQFVSHSYCKCWCTQLLFFSLWLEDACQVFQKSRHIKVLFNLLFIGNGCTWPSSRYSNSLNYSRLYNKLMKN